MQAPRIAVWLCGCQGQISDALDLEALAATVREWPHVVHVETAAGCCNPAATEGFRKRFADAGADRLLFAGCSPRSSLKFPEEEIAAALSGVVDSSLFEVANTREQGVWLHEAGPGLEAKALDELRMAHARLCTATPSSPPVPVAQRALVVGGGPAGLATAKELAGMGREVTLVEQAPSVGGRMAQIRLLFQSEQWDGRCLSLCVGPVQALGTLVQRKVTAFTQTEVTSITKHEGNFRARLSSAAQPVDPAACVACGACSAVCPEFGHSGFNEGLFARKAIDKDAPRAVPDAYTILDDVCTRCGACEEVCPAGAIDLKAEPEERVQDYGAVFLATGFETLDLSQEQAFHTDAPNVVHGMQFERMLDQGITNPQTGEAPEHIVFVLCAGSRATADKSTGGVPYCSKTCCGATMRQAQQVARLLPETAVSILYYYDVRTYERSFEAMYDMVQKMGVEFVQGDLTAIADAEDGAVRLTIRQIGEQTTSSMGEFEFDPEGHLDIDADLVVLASAQTPRQQARRLADQLGVALDNVGFPIENQPRIFRPTECFVDRVYYTGASSGPKVVQQAVEQGKAAAMTALPALHFGQKTPPKHSSHLNRETCIQCRMCETVCPHGAIRLTEEGMVADPAFCQACGLCAAACPTHAAQLANFTDRQLLDQAEVAFSALPEGEPRILALLCYWCSYCGADMAGTERRKAPSNVRSIRIRCSSSVNTGLLLEMFRRGVDGILVGGCPTKSCHHLHGNYLADKRIGLAQNLLEQLGLDSNRLRFANIGVAHGKEFVDIVGAMDGTLRKLGPNPAAQGRLKQLVEAPRARRMQ